MKVFISPFFRGEDKGDGGIRRVWESQVKGLPKFGIELVDNEESADVVAIHAGADVRTLKPIVAHCHGLYWSEYKWDRWAHALNKDVINVMNKATIVTAVSEWVANSIRRGMMIPAEVIYHSIDCSEWQPGTNGGYILWNKTRVDEVCDPSVVNDLANILKSAKFISTFGNKTNNVQVTGKLPFNQAKDYIRNADIYLCSARETFGIGTLEALACGVPILGWKWGGQAEFIENGKHGWLSIPGDMQDLVKGYEYICLHRNEISKNCIELAREFTLDRACAKYSEIYKKAYEEEHPPVKVSVVIPVYNLGEMALDAIKSVKDQKFKDYEIVLVNDASTDNSREILEPLCKSDSNIHLINNENNQYLAGALNTGIESAKGKYIIPLDADNMLGENALEVLSGELDKDPTIGVAYGSMEVIEPDGKRFISGWPTQFNFRHQLTHHNQCPSTSMYRKRIWKRVGGYRTRCRTAEDADFWCRVSSYGGNPKKVTDAVTLIYRNRHDSMSHKESDWAWNDWYIWSKRLEFTPYVSSALYGLTILVNSYDPAKISVVIPCGPSHSKYLPDSIDSIITQSFTKTEVIVVNDSQDTLKVPSFVKVFNTDKVGSGPAISRNIGIRNSKAPLIFLLDADDYLQPSALEDLYESMTASNEYIYSDWIIQESKEIKYAPEYDCDDILRRLPHTISCLFPRKAWIDVGGFDENLGSWEDWDFILALNDKGYCGVRVPEALLQYRMSSGTIREKIYQDRENAKLVLLEKWADYFSGGKKFMACGGCGKRRSSTSRVVSGINVSKAATAVNTGSNTAILIEFTKVGAGATSYRGKSGTIYRFGSDSEHRIRYVFKDDVPGLLALRDFRVVNTEINNVLEAKGPPQR